MSWNRISSGNFNPRALASSTSCAPPGCSTFYALAPVPHLGKARLDWDALGPRYARRILDYLEARYIPGLRAAFEQDRPQAAFERVRASASSARSRRFRRSSRPA